MVEGEHCGLSGSVGSGPSPVSITPQRGHAWVQGSGASICLHIAFPSSFKELRVPRGA